MPRISKENMNPFIKKATLKIELNSSKRHSLRSCITLSNPSMSSRTYNGRYFALKIMIYDILLLTLIYQ